MQTHMRNGTNLLQVSYNDLLLVLNTNSRHTIQNALNELIEKGFIAIKIKGKGRISNVYMVNPEIAIKGNCNIDYLTREFWKLTNTTYKDYSNDIEVMSSAYSNFNDLINKGKPYSMGYNKQETKKGTIYFNKLNPPKLSKSYIEFMTKAIDEMGDLPI